MPRHKRLRDFLFGSNINNVKLGYLRYNTAQPWGILNRKERILDGIDPGAASFNGYSLNVKLQHLDYMLAGRQRDLLLKLAQWHVNHCKIIAYTRSMDNKWVSGRVPESQAAFRGQQSSVKIVVETGKGWDTLLNVGLQILVEGPLSTVTGFSKLGEVVRSALAQDMYDVSSVFAEMPLKLVSNLLSYIENNKLIDNNFINKLLASRHGREEMRIRFTSELPRNVKDTPYTKYIDTRHSTLTPLDAIALIFARGLREKLALLMDYNCKAGLDIVDLRQAPARQTGRPIVSSSEWGFRQ